MSERLSSRGGSFVLTVAVVTSAEVEVINAVSERPSSRGGSFVLAVVVVAFAEVDVIFNVAGGGGGGVHRRRRHRRRRSRSSCGRRCLQRCRRGRRFSDIFVVAATVFVAAGAGANAFESFLFPFYGRGIALSLPFCGRLRGRRFSESCVIAATVSVPAGVGANAFEPSSASVAAGAENVIEPLLPICGRLRSKRFSDSFFVAATFSVVLGAGAIAIAPLFPSLLASSRCGAGAVVIWPSPSQFCYRRWHYSPAGIPPLRSPSAWLVPDLVPTSQVSPDSVGTTTVHLRRPSAASHAEGNRRGRIPAGE